MGDIIALHNKERQAIGGSNVMAVTWDDDLASLAQEWTDSCNNRHGHLKLPDGRAVGQNRAWSGKGVLDLAQGWVDEKSIYNVRSGRCNHPDFKSFSKVPVPRHADIAGLRIIPRREGCGS